MFKKVFVIVSLLLGLEVYTIGWVVNIYGLGWAVGNRNGMIVFVVFILIVSFCVSYRSTDRMQVVNLLVFLLSIAFFFVARLVYLQDTLVVLFDHTKRSTNFGSKEWVISPDVKPNVGMTRYLVCTLQDTKMCFSYKAFNLVIYRPYQLCNINGDLVYKEINKIRTYDILKNTYLFGNDISLECRDTWISKLFRFREDVANRIDNLIPKPQSSLLNGIIFGMDLHFNSNFERGIQSAGISHIVAASGYNVNILVLALDKFLGKVPTKAGLVIKIVFIWLYALLTGFSSSMVRASAMTTISFAIQIFNKKADVKEIFWLTLSVLIFINPLIVFDLGFLLSGAATWGLMYISPVLEEKIKIKGFPHTTLACTLATLPITMLHFKTFSPYSVLANMFVLPVIEIVMLLGIAGLFFSPLIYLAWGCLKFVEIVASFFSYFPFAVVELSDLSSIVCVFSVILSIFLLLNSKNERKSNIYNS